MRSREKMADIGDFIAARVKHEFPVKPVFKSVLLFLLSTISSVIRYNAIETQTHIQDTRHAARILRFGTRRIRRRTSPTRNVRRLGL